MKTTLLVYVLFCIGVHVCSSEESNSEVNQQLPNENTDVQVLQVPDSSESNEHFHIENHNEESTEKKGSRCYPGYPGYRPYTSGSGAAAAAAASAASFGRTTGAAPFLLGPPGVIAPRTGGAAFSHASGVAYGGASGPWLNPATNKAAANANAMAASQGISPSFGRTNSIQRTAASAGAQSFAANNGGYFGAPVVVPRNHYNRFYPGSAGSAAAAAASAASNTGGYTYG